MNDTIRPLMTAPAGARPRAAIFLSGSGTNAERLLEHEARGETSYDIALLVTDAPATGRGPELAARWNKPLAALDIREFYAQRGLGSISLATPEGRAVREEWTAELRRLLAPQKPDFGVLAGFVPLTNLTGDFPCLNVHPGDLTVTGADGRRLLVGLHTVPIEKAILAGRTTLRSSVILALSYTGSGGGDMDSGPLLGISPEIPVELGSFTLTGLEAVQAARTRPRRPDVLSQLAAAHQERLKVAGDWVVLPPAVEAFARGCYGRRGDELCWRDGADAPWRRIFTVEFAPDGSARPRFLD